MSQKSKFYVEVRAIHSQVTGSCYVCKIKFSNDDKKIFIVDIGLFQELEYLDLNEKLTFNSEDVNFVLLTHNHVDHVGRLPLLYHRGCRAKTYVTKATSMLLRPNLYDNLKIMQERVKRAKKNLAKVKWRINGVSNNWFYSPLYMKKDVDDALEHVVPVEYYTWYNDPLLPSVNFKFYPNAHIPGSSMILVEIVDFENREKINLLFMGDYNERNIFQGSFDFPNELREIPINIISESTYGTTYTSEIVKSLERNISNAVKENKAILLPVISQYRAQEILYYLKEMQRRGDIPINYPIYFSGTLGIEYINIYRKPEFTDIPEEKKNFIPNNLIFLSLKEKMIGKEYLSPGIYIATGGMGSNGPSASYLPYFLKNPKACIIFSSYCAAETNGRKIKETETGDEVILNNTPVKKLATVYYTSELSGHAKANQIIDFFNKFSNIKVILIAHGETEVKNEFAKNIISKRIAKEVMILDRSNYVRLNPWGILEIKKWVD